MTTDRQVVYQFKKADDVQSLVKTVYLFLHPDEASLQPGKDDFQDLWKMLLNYWKGAPRVWREALRATTASDARNLLMWHFRL